MGRGFGIKCQECSYEKRFILGIGMMYSPENLMDLNSEFSILSLINSSRTRKLVRELITHKNGNILDGYGHAIYYCNKCGDYHNRFIFSIEYEGGIYTPFFKCNKCKIAIEKQEIDDYQDVDLDKYKCPICGKNKLFVECIMNWD